MNPDRRRVLRGAAGGAILCLGAGRLAAQTLPDAPRPAPARLQVRGAELPVQLRAVRVLAEIGGRLALTSVEFEFHNPNPRVLEGELQFPLLDGQSVVGMAMEVDGAMREAVPVDKARGEQVFEDVTRARIDPALLSATQGQNHKLRVYPLPALGRKRVVIRYAESLAARGEQLAWRLPLDFGERVGELSIAIRVAGAQARPVVAARGQVLPAFVATPNGQAFDWQLRDAAPRGLLELALAAGGTAGINVGQRDGRRFFVAQLPVAPARRPRPLPRVVVLAWDSSGSGAERDHGREFALLDAYFAAARDTEVRLVRLRDTAEPVQAFMVRGGDWGALRRSLEDTAYDGATDLGALPAVPAGGELLLFTDGLANFGAEATSAPGRPPAPVFVVSAALRSDPARLRGLAELSGGAFIDLLALDADAARARLLERGTRLVRMVSNAATRLVAASATPDEGWLTLAGELTEARGALRLTLESPDGTPRELTLALPEGGEDGALAPLAWARLQIDALQVDAALNRAEIRRLSQAFGIVGAETSLIILDRAEDYARHDITPPPELAEAVAALRATAAQARQRNERAQLEQVVQAFARKQAWWERRFAQDRPPRQAQEQAQRQELQRSRAADGADAAGAVAPSAPPRPLAAAAPQLAEAGVARERAAKSAGGAARGAADSVIRLQPAAPDGAWARRLRATPKAQLYRVYLDERAGFARSTAFFLDAAELMFERGLDALALRVLSNLAELDLENRQVLRILAQRLLQAGRPRLAVPLLRRVLALAPHEPQSWRDLGLALAADGQPQAAIETLHEVVRRPWPRFPEIELITLAELNAIVARHGPGLDSSCIDPRLLRHLPLDLRVVLSWDSDNSDVDLWVTDPNGERVFYGHPLSHQGGRISQDNTGGYGPEEFSLRRARPGVYRVEAQFYGHRQQIVASATTIQLVLSTAFGLPGQVDKRVTLRLREPKDRVFVGEFELRGAGS